MLTCFSKNFGQTVENVSHKLKLFGTKCKNLTVNVQKGKKLSRQNLSKIFSGHAKSRWEIIVAKVFAKKFYLFLWKSKKNTKRRIVFQIFAFFQTDPLDWENILPQFYPRLLEVGLVIHASFFFNKKTKRCRSRSEKLKKFRIFSEKDFFVENVQSKCKFGNWPIVSC